MMYAHTHIEVEYRYTMYDMLYLRSSGADPDDVTLVGARTTLNDFVPGFPEGVQKGLARSQGEGPPG